LEIDAASISEQAKAAIQKQVKEPVLKFNFEILLKEKFPFKAPVVTTRTSFSNPSLADGRDLLD
jgi:hypothetical protein